MGRSIEQWSSDNQDAPLPPRVRDIRGKRFNSLVVKAFSGYIKSGNGRVAAWDCVCDCGTIKRASGVELAQWPARDALPEMPRQPSRAPGRHV